MLRAIAALSDRAGQLARQMSTQALANIIWAAAKLKGKAPNLLRAVPALSDAALLRADEMIARQVANVVWALGVLSADRPGLAQLAPKLAAAAAGRLPQMTLQELANTCWGLALCGARDEAYMASAASTITALAHRVPDEDASLWLPSAACACARLRVRSLRMLRSVADRVASLPPRRLLPWGLCALLWSYNTLDEEGAFLSFRRVLEDEVTRRRLTLEDVELSHLGPDKWQGR